MGTFGSQDQHESLTHTLKFEAYELPKPAGLLSVSPVSFASSTELVPAAPEPSYPREIHQGSSIPSVSDTGSTEVKLRLDGVQKKWGRPTPAPSTQTSTSQEKVNTVNEFTELNNVGIVNSKRYDVSYDSSRAQVEISPEKQKLAVSLFGGSSKPEKISSTSHKVSKASSRAGVKSHTVPEGSASSMITTDKYVSMQPPPDLLDLGETTSASTAPSVDPFKQLEGLLELSRAISSEEDGAIGARKMPDIMALYAEPPSGQSGCGADCLSTNGDEFNILSGLSIVTNKTSNGGSSVVQPTQLNKGPNFKYSLEKDALVRQMGVNPSSHNPNLFKDLLG